MVRTLTSASCRILDRELSDRDARVLCGQSIDGAAPRSCRGAALVEVARACVLVADLMSLFCRRWSARRSASQRTR